MKKLLVATSVVLAFLVLGFREGKDEKPCEPIETSTGAKAIELQYFDKENRKKIENFKVPFGIYIQAKLRWASTEKRLHAAKTVFDVVDYLPNHRISDDCKVTIGVKDRFERSTGKDLSIGQLKLLRSVQPSDIVYLEVNSYEAGTVWGMDLISSINGSKKHVIERFIAVTPIQEAQYLGNVDEYNSYLKSQLSIIDQLEPIDSVNQFEVTFSVNREGKVENIQLEKSSDKLKVNNILNGLVQKLSNWKPAKNELGEEIIQEYKLIVGLDGGC